MITDLTFNDFCRKHFIDARRVADIAVANFITKHGQPHRSIDLELVKDTATYESLRKAYDRFDCDNKKEASIETFLSIIVKNQVLTELRKEGTAVKAGNTGSIDAEDGKDIETNDAGTKDIKALRLKVNECIEKLAPIDKTIILCYMENKKSYRSDALSKLGWGPERRGEVTERLKRASAQLREMLNEFGPSKAKEEKPKADRPPKGIVYVRDIPLKNMGWVIELTKKYFGFNHPSMQAEYDLIKIDPDRTIKLYERVLYENIETAFDEGKFTYKEEDKVAYVEFLWFVANLYYGNSYQLYEDANLDMKSNVLMWEDVFDDIRAFYAFMWKHGKKNHITIKIGKDKTTLKNTDGWFDALMDNHLFPKCLPSIYGKELPPEESKKKGRKIKNKVATAIINGIARLFADEELIQDQAPKNLCAFIKEYLILMDILDLDYSVISGASIKSAIDYASKKEDDPRLPTIEWENATMEDLPSSGINPGEKWLYGKEE